MEIKYWIFGLLLSIVIGGVCTELFLNALRTSIGLGKKPKPRIRRVPSWVTGVVERTFFTVLVAMETAGTAPAMIGWLAIKLATNWNRGDWNKNPKTRYFAFTALLAGLVSMLFATLGGMVCNGKLWANFISSI